MSTLNRHVEQYRREYPIEAAKADARIRILDRARVCKDTIYPDYSLNLVMAEWLFHRGVVCCPLRIFFIYLSTPARYLDYYIFRYYMEKGAPFQDVLEFTLKFGPDIDVEYLIAYGVQPYAEDEERYNERKRTFVEGLVLKRFRYPIATNILHFTSNCK